MPTYLTVKGQVTIPKRVRESLGLLPGDGVAFEANDQGQIVVSKADPPSRHTQGAEPLDRFAAVRGSIKLNGSVDDFMAMVRGDVEGDIHP